MSFDATKIIPSFAHSALLYGAGSQSQSAVGHCAAMSFAWSGFTVVNLVASTSDGHEFDDRVAAWSRREDVKTRLETHFVKLPDRPTVPDFISAIANVIEGHHERLFVMHDTSRLQY